MDFVFVFFLMKSYLYPFFPVLNTLKINGAGNASIIIVIIIFISAIYEKISKIFFLALELECPKDIKWFKG